MNSALNILISRLITALFSSRRSRILTSLVAAVLATLGGVTAYSPGADTASTKASSVKEGSYSLKGRVVHVADGDTFTIQVDGRQQRVRLASIDAPETTKDRQQPGQPMAQESKKALDKLVAGKNVDLRCYERDQYDRNICDVLLADGSTVNQQQVAMGMAWANMEGRGKYMRDPKLPGLEQKARQARQGIWQDANPVKPWAWRYQCWKKAQC